jgi:UDP:flavonoid glycosyltransferase YjiC (YdhE family)
MIRAMISNPRFSALMKFRKANGLHWGSTIETPYRADLHYICPSIAETDFPMDCPPNLFRCGPIILDPPPVAVADPELFQWLNQAPTVYISLGTHFQYSESDVTGILGGLLSALSPEVQVLWKLSNYEEHSSTLEDIFAHHGKEKRANYRILSWIGPEPSVVLQHPNVKCFVNHGGANSFFEGC